MIIIQVKSFLSQENYKQIVEEIQNQAKEGVIVLRPICELAAITEDEEAEVIRAEESRPTFDKIANILNVDFLDDGTTFEIEEGQGHE